jgi:AdoMet-dependent rRNA methyltransferase SPB1|tara:strand:- start:1926 stop:3605 length:1680 start_codon:yes stop_codon:yes gene_type:complete
VANQAAPSVPADYYEDSDSELNAARRKQNQYDSEDSDAENDVENDTSRLDSSLDALYKQYKERQKKKGRSVGEGSSKGRDKRATLEDEDDGDLGSDDVNNSDGSDSEETRFDEDDDAPLEWENNANEEDEEMNPKKKKHKNKNNLIVEFDPSKVKQNAKATADRWFSNDLFSEIEKSTSTEPKKVAKKTTGTEQEKKKEKKNDKAEDGDDEDEDDYESLREHARARKLEKAKEAAKIAKEGELKSKKQKEKLDKKRKKAGGGKSGAEDTTYDSGSDDVDVGRKKRAQRAAAAAAEDVDVVPRGKDDDDRDSDDVTDDDDVSDRDEEKGMSRNRRRRADGSDSDESTDVDELSDGTRAEILAIGKKMLRRKQREEIIEDAYNRYAFEDDPRDLPDWFVDDERRFMKAEPIYDQRDYEEALSNVSIKVDERSIKKVAEAKLRKKKRAKDKMSEARQRAGAIMDQDDIPDVSKVREIEAIYAKANKLVNGRKKQIKHVVARKLHKGNAGGPSVDKRMLADKRGQKAAMKRGGGGSGGKGGKKGKSPVGKPKKSSLRKNRPRR